MKQIEEFRSMRDDQLDAPHFSEIALHAQAVGILQFPTAIGDGLRPCMDVFQRGVCKSLMNFSPEVAFL